MTRSYPPEVLPAAEAYRRWAPNYDSTPNPLLALEERVLAPRLLSLACGDLVDLGCGTGRWLRRLEATALRSLTGVDSSQPMLDQAAKRLYRSRLVCAACSHTGLDPASFDLVLASFVASYLDNLEALAAEVSRVCRSGASVFISDVHPATATYGWRRTFHDSRRVFELETHAYPINALHSAMHEFGLALSHCTELPFGEPERGIFALAGRPELYTTVEDLPVLFVAEYRRVPV